MRFFDWNTEKNEQLIRERGISFEEIVFSIMQNPPLDIVEHPNREKYPGQRIFIVEVDGYAYLVPFVEEGDVIFLKTIIPSRKMTGRYLGDSDEA